MRRVAIALSLVFFVSAHVQAEEKPSPSAPAKPPPAPPQKSPASTGSAAPGAAPPPEFYVEPAVGGTAPPPPQSAPPAPSSGPPAALPSPPGPPPPAPTGPAIIEPPTPEYYPENDGVFEPPPPPEPHHVAPRTAMVLGVRAGLFVPLGSLWARCTNCNAASTDQYVNLQGVPWRDYSTSGPMFELDAGARLSRNYVVFALWERAELGAGNGDPEGGFSGHASHGDTDFWGVGIRASSNADRIGFVTELAVGYRRARAKWDDGSELQLTDAPFEGRLGLGADFRLNQYVTLSPMFTLGVGSFGKIERVTSGTVADATTSVDQDDGHAWATFTVGGFFDLLGSQQ